MIIDAHAHVADGSVLPMRFFESWADNVTRGLPPEGRAGLVELFCQLNCDPDCKKLLEEMNAAKIDKTVLLIIDFGLVFTESGSLEALYQSHRELLARHPDRFVVFAGIDPRRGNQGLELFEWSLRDWGFGGLKLYPPCGYSPSDRSLFPYYELCRKYHVPVLSHLGPTAPCLSFKYTRPEDMEEAAHAFPDVNFILGHAGVVLHEEAGLLAEYRPNVYLELSGFQTELRRKTFMDIMRRHKQRGTVRKLIFGTDWPIHRFFGKQQAWVAEMRKTVAEGVLTEDELDQVLCRNAAEILNLGTAN